MNKDKLTARFINDPSCTLLKMGENYNHLVADLGKVRIGLKAMIDSFHVVRKSNRVSDLLKESVAVFAVNTSEAIRIECVFDEISKAFDDQGIRYLGDFLAFLVHKYGYYSKQYLKCLDYILSGLPVPDIVNHPGMVEFPGKEIRSVHDLRRIYKVPLRTNYNLGNFTCEEVKKPPAWSPPYPDGKDWVCEEEDEEVQEKKLGEEELVLEDESCDDEEKELKDENHEDEDEDEWGEKQGEEKEQEEGENKEENLEQPAMGKKIPVFNKDNFPVLRMTGSISRFAEAAKAGGISHIGEYRLFASSCRWGFDTVGHHQWGLAATTGGSLKAAQFRSGYSLASPMLRRASRSIRFLYRFL